MEVRRSTRIMISVVGTWDQFLAWCRTNHVDPYNLGITEDEVDALNSEAEDFENLPGGPPVNTPLGEHPWW